jgi:type I restriction enzyme R subunit
MARIKSEDGTTLRSTSSPSFSREQGIRSSVRELRRQQTAAERALWNLLRARHCEGLKFRRQFPIPPFIADFCCFELRLIVEVDGGVHETAAQSAHDGNRDSYLVSLGYTVLRFPNLQIFQDSSTVLQRIAAEARRLRSDHVAPMPEMP